MSGCTGSRTVTKMTLHSPDVDETCSDESDIAFNLGRCASTLDWAVLFGNAQPVEIEVGCGKGRFIIQSARGNAAVNYFGIERSSKFFRVLKQRVLQSGVSNIRLLRGEADYFIRKYVPPGSVQAYHIYFPDPWPKKRHHKRRLVTAGFIETLQASLIAGGCIFFATDFKDYFDIMIAGARTCPGLTELGCATVLPPDVNPETAATSYERKYLIQGRPIYKAVYKKT